MELERCEGAPGRKERLATRQSPPTYSKEQKRAKAVGERATKREVLHEVGTHVTCAVDGSALLMGAKAEACRAPKRHKEDASRSYCGVRRGTGRVSGCERRHRDASLRLFCQMLHRAVDPRSPRRLSRSTRWLHTRLDSVFTSQLYVAKSLFDPLCLDGWLTHTCIRTHTNTHKLLC